MRVHFVVDVPFLAFRPRTHRHGNIKCHGSMVDAFVHFQYYLPFCYSSRALVDGAKQYHGVPTIQHNKLTQIYKNIKNHSNCYFWKCIFWWIEILWPFSQSKLNSLQYRSVHIHSLQAVNCALFTRLRCCNLSCQFNGSHVIKTFKTKSKNHSNNE